MFWIVLAAAAQLTAPIPTNLKEWFTANDVPPYLQKDGVWDVGVRVVVAADGTVRACVVQMSSGIRDLDRQTCDLIRSRGHFQAARWTDGTAVTGVYSTAVTYKVSTWPFDDRLRPEKGDFADLDITIARLPAGRKSPSLVRAMFAVDAGGSLSSCTAEATPNFITAENDPQLVPVACEQLLKNYKPLPFKDSGGHGLPSVQDALVRFSQPQ